MVRLATDALAVVCILVGGAAGTAITLAALDDGPRATAPGERDVMRHAVVSVGPVGAVRGTSCRVALAPEAVVTTPGDGPTVDIRARAVQRRPGVAASARVCSEINRAFLERHRARLEASRVEVEASRARVEAVSRALRGETLDEKRLERRH